MSTPQPTQTAYGRRKVGFVGALLGALGLAASVLVLSTGAGAQTDSPELTEPAPAEVVVDEDDNAYDAYDACIDLVLSGFGDQPEPSDEALAEFEGSFEACEAEIPDGEFEISPEWEAYDSCLNDELGFDNIADESIDAITDQQFDAADATCETLLPQDVQDQNAAFKAYDTCLVDNGVDFGDEFEGDFEGDLDEDFEFAPNVSVMTDDSASFAEFGEGDGTVTITKVGDTITVTSTGDVSVDNFDFGDDFEEVLDPELEAAFAACENLLPDDVFFGDIGIEPSHEDNEA